MNQITTDSPMEHHSLGLETVSKRISEKRPQRCEPRRIPTIYLKCDDSNSPPAGRAEKCVDEAIARASEGVQ